MSKRLMNILNAISIAVGIFAIVVLIYGIINSLV